MRAGGYVHNGRINGELAVARALGDFHFKKDGNLDLYSQMVSSHPDMTIKDLSSKSKFILIACDGIWDCLSS